MPGRRRADALPAIGIGKWKGYDDGDAPGCVSLPVRRRTSILRKEVIQPQVPLRLPCYDFTPVADLTVVGCLLS